MIQNENHIFVCDKLSLFIVEIMDEKTYRSIVQATQADTAKIIRNMAAGIIALESSVAIEIFMALKSSTFNRGCPGGVK